MHTRSKRFSSIVLAMSAILLVLSGCSYEPAYMGESAYENVVVIGIDGGGGLFDDGDAVIDDFKDFFGTSDSSIGYEYSCETPSISAQNWGSFLHGVTPDKLEVNNIKIGVERFTNRKYPSVFQVIRNADPSCELASFCGWTPINYGLIETTAKVHKVPDQRFIASIYSDQEITDLVCDYLDTTLPKLLYVHLNEVDETGHSYGYGTTEHMDAIKTAQEQALEIFSKYDTSKTLFIVVCDHGGTPDGEHGGDTEAEMKIVFAIRGNTVNPAGMTGSFYPRDLAPIILHALNITIPSTMEGDPHTSLFND